MGRSTERTNINGPLFQPLLVLSVTFFVMTGCGIMAGNSDSSPVEVTLEVGQLVSDVPSELSRISTLNERPALVTIGKPHILHIKVGNEKITVRPGGWNSQTYIPTGLHDKDYNSDYSRISSINSDTGTELLNSVEARDMALRFCKIGAKGLGQDSYDGIVDDLDFLKVKKEPLTICSVENASLSYDIQLSRLGKNYLDRDEQYGPDDKVFKLIVSVSEKLELP